MDRPRLAPAEGWKGAMGACCFGPDTGRPARPRLGHAAVHPLPATGQRGLDELVAGRHETPHHERPFPPHLRRVPRHRGEAIPAMDTAHHRAEGRRAGPVRRRGGLSRELPPPAGLDRHRRQGVGQRLPG